MEFYLFFWFYLKKIFFFLIQFYISNQIVNQNVNIKNCLISIVSSIDNDGAISIISGYSLIIIETTFYQCISTKGHGGAIYFYDGLNIQLFGICFLGCKGSSFQSAYLRTNHNNLIDLISIYSCINLNAHNNLGLQNGNQNIYNTNISNTNNAACSCIRYEDPNSMFTNYCTFYKNTVSSNTCIRLFDNSGTISKSNIILNNSPNYGVVYVTSGGHYILNEYIFAQNQDRILDLATGSTIQLINCYLLSGSSSSRGKVTNSLTFTQTNYFLHSIYSTYYCSYTLFQSIPTPSISRSLSPSISRSFSPSNTNREILSFSIFFLSMIFIYSIISFEI